MRQMWDVVDCGSNYVHLLLAQEAFRSEPAPRLMQALHSRNPAGPA